MKKIQITYPKILIGASLVGLIASFWQAAERVHMLKFPTQDLSCNISPVVECGGVLNDGLAAVFGPPNALIGVVVFSLLLAFGLQRLQGGQWNNIVRKLAVIFSVIIMLFSLWFFWVSLYVIGKICIFCVFIWASSMPIGIYGVKDYLQSIKKPTGIFKSAKELFEKQSFSILVGVYSIMIILFFLKFQDYYFG